MWWKPDHRQRRPCQASPPPWSPPTWYSDCRLDVRPSVFADRENAPNGCDQPVEFDRLGFELVAAGGERLIALSCQRVSRKGYHGNVAGFRIVLQPAGGLPAVHDG